MSDSCPECGRPFALSEAAYDATHVPSDERSNYPNLSCGMGPGCADSVMHYEGYLLSECRQATIVRLKRENHAMRALFGWACQQFHHVCGGTLGWYARIGKHAVPITADSAINLARKLDLPEAP